VPHANVICMIFSLESFHKIGNVMLLFKVTIAMKKITKDYSQIIDKEVLHF